MAVTKLDQAGICCNEITELTASRTVLVVDSDTVLKSLLCDLHAEDVLELLFDVSILCAAEYVSCGLSMFPVLRMCEDDLRSRAFPLLAHALKGIAGDGENDSVKLVISAFQLQFHNGLHDGACERRKQGPCFGDLLALSAPHTDREIASSMDDLFRTVNRHNADCALAGLFLKIIHRFLRIISDCLEL